MSRNKLTYASAIAKLEEIIRDIESGETDLDTLTEKVKKASELITFCKKRLRSAQEEVEEILKDADEKNGRQTS